MQHQQSVYTCDVFLTINKKCVRIMYETRTESKLKKKSKHNRKINNIYVKNTLKIMMINLHVYFIKLNFFGISFYYM
jgi:hypothetical protein